MGGSSQRLPLGLYTNLCSLRSRTHRGRPSLFHLGSDLHYDGPLPPSCTMPLCAHPTERSGLARRVPLLIFLGTGRAVLVLVCGPIPLKTLPSGSEAQLMQRILVPCLLYSHRGTQSALIFLLFRLIVETWATPQMARRQFDTAPIC